MEPRSPRGPRALGRGGPAGARGLGGSRRRRRPTGWRRRCAAAWWCRARRGRRRPGWDAVAWDLLPGRPLHPETWALLLEPGRLRGGRPAGRTCGLARLRHDRAGGPGERDPPVRAHAPPGRRRGPAHHGACTMSVPPGWIESEIYVELEDPETAGLTSPATATRDGAVRRRPRVPVRHRLGPGRWVAARSETLVVNYHNVTPPPLFAPWDDGLARHQVRALDELGAWPAGRSLGVAVSELNRVGPGGRRLRRHRRGAPGGRSCDRPGPCRTATPRRRGPGGWPSGGWRPTRRSRTPWRPSSPTAPPRPRGQARGGGRAARRRLLDRPAPLRRRARAGRRGALPGRVDDQAPR